MMNDLFNHTNPPDTLRIKVTAKAKAERIKKVIGPDGGVLYKLYVTAVAENGKANEAVIKLLADAIGIPKSSIEITRGLTSRDKIIQINLHKTMGKRQ